MLDARLSSAREQEGTREQGAEGKRPEPSGAAGAEHRAMVSETGDSENTETPEDTNVWPTEAEETAFLSEARERGEKVVPVPHEAAEETEEDAKALPKLDELVNRIPAEARELLDELFRARFTTVRRVRKRDLKTQG